MQPPHKGMVFGKLCKLSAQAFEIARLKDHVAQAAMQVITTDGACQLGHPGDKRINQFRRDQAIALRAEWEESVVIVEREIAMGLVDRNRQFVGSKALIEAFAELRQSQPLAPVDIEIVFKRAVLAEFQDASPPAI